MTRSPKERITILVISIILLIAISLSLLFVGIFQISIGNHIIGEVTISVGMLILIVGGISVRLYNQRTLAMVGKVDDKSTFIQYKAGYYSFVASMYIIVMMMILVEAFGASRSIFYLGLVCNFAVFIILYSIFNHKRDSVAIEGDRSLGILS